MKTSKWDEFVAASKVVSASNQPPSIESVIASSTRPRRRKLLAPLTPEEWEQLSGKARWDSIVALRGPDLPNSGTLKWYTTSVIRHRLSHVMRVGGLVNGSMPFVIIPQFTDTPGFDAGHFIGHVCEASDWLNIPRYQCGHEASKLMFQGAGQASVQSLLSKDSALPDKVRAFFSNGTILEDLNDAN